MFFLENGNCKIYLKPFKNIVICFNKLDIDEVLKQLEKSF